MQKRYGRQICCICMIVIFLTGIFGQINDMKHIFFTMQTETADAKTTVSFLSAETWAGIDDFHITADTGRTISGMYAGVRGVTLYMAALLLLCFFGSIPPKRRSRFREKRIFVFRIVTFIHRIDGKKKSCFDFKNWIKTGGYFKWKLVQNIKFCL